MQLRNMQAYLQTKKLHKIKQDTKQTLPIPSADCVSRHHNRSCVMYRYRRHRSLRAGRQSRRVDSRRSDRRVDSRRSDRRVDRRIDSRHNDRCVESGRQTSPPRVHNSRLFLSRVCMRPERNRLTKCHLHKVNIWRVCRICLNRARQSVVTHDVYVSVTY